MLDQQIACLVCAYSFREMWVQGNKDIVPVDPRNKSTLCHLIQPEPALWQVLRVGLVSSQSAWRLGEAEVL